MPSRYVRAGLLGSEAIKDAGEAAEVLYVRLLLLADDFGRYDGRPGFIQSQAWPLGGPSVQDIEHRLQVLSGTHGPDGTPLIVRYRVKNKPFIYIPKFGQRTRASKSKFPDPIDGQVPDKIDTNGGHVSDRWQTAVSQPQAGSVSGSLDINNTVVDNRGESTELSTRPAKSRGTAIPQPLRKFLTPIEPPKRGNGAHPPASLADLPDEPEHDHESPGTTEDAPRGTPTAPDA